jgi:hypothetical protein
VCFKFSSICRNLLPRSRRGSIPGAESISRRLNQLPSKVLEGHLMADLDQMQGLHTLHPSVGHTSLRDMDTHLSFCPRPASTSVGTTSEGKCIILAYEY